MAGFKQDKPRGNGLYLPTRPGDPVAYPEPLEPAQVIRKNSNPGFYGETR